MNEPTRVDPVAAARDALANGPSPDAPPRASAEDELRDQRERVQRSTWYERIPTRFAHANLDDLHDELAETLVGWGERVLAGDGENLVIVGPVGTGKTYAAVAACRPVHFGGEGVAFWPVVELLDALRPGAHRDDDHDDLYDALLQVPVLILDDLGAERPTDWTTERLYALVNRRWLDMRPTVVTSNVPADQIESAIGERLLSRLTHDALVYRLSGKDRRR